MQDLGWSDVALNTAGRVLASAGSLMWQYSLATCHSNGKLVNCKVAELMQPLAC